VGEGEGERRSGTIDQISVGLVVVEVPSPLGKEVKKWRGSQRNPGAVAWGDKLPFNERKRRKRQTCHSSSNSKRGAHGCPQRKRTVGSGSREVR